MMLRNTRNWAVVLIGFLIIWYVAAHLGAFPWIQGTSWFSYLSLFVTVNTLSFATLAAAKLGFRLGATATAPRTYDDLDMPSTETVTAELVHAD